jgi:hypothetical protein
VNPDPYRKSCVVLSVAHSVKRSDALDDRKSCSHGALGFVFVRDWIAEVRQHPIAQVLRNMAIESRDRFGGDLLIARGQFAPFLGIKPG